MRAQRGEIERALDDQRRHAGRTFGAGDRDAVHRRLDDAGERCKHRSDFRGGHVLAFPAEGVADTVDEIEEAVSVLAHQIAGAIPGVAALKHVAQDLALGIPFAGVALEGAT